LIISKPSITNPLLVAGALYFGYYLALGSYLPYISLYFQRMGLSGMQIGLLAAIPVLVTSSTALIWSGFADARRWHRQILHTNLLLAAVVVLLLSTASTFQALIPFIVVFALFTGPIVPLLDSSSLEIAESHHSSYGRLRLWGAIGWIFANLLIGFLIQKLNIHWLFYGCTIALLITFLFSFYQPKRQHVLKTSLGGGLKALFLSIPFLVFLVSMLLISLTFGAANTFFSIYLDSIGAKESIIGLGWAVAAMSEIPVLLYSGHLMRRFGSTGLLKISFATLVVRWILYGFIHTPFLAILVQLLHGLSFSTYLVGSVTYVNERAPEGMSTSALSVLNIVTFGIGSFCGALIGGYLYQTVGITWFFTTLSLIIIFAFGLFQASQRGQLRPANS
jgi:PPP family 3-phenylpropionic acid transporter